MSSAETKMVATRRFGAAVVEVVIGDITEQYGFDAIVHPTNERMALDGGVGVAIRKKADVVALEEACREFLPLEKCSVALTPVAGLCSSNLIHLRGPRLGEPDAADGLRDTYRNVLKLAEESGLKSIALPAVSTGFKGFSAEQSGFLALEAIRDESPAYSNLKLIRFVLANESSALAFSEAMQALPKIPESCVRIDLPNKYSAADFQALRRGYLGSPETKWFFYYEEPWLLITRGTRRRGGGAKFYLRLPEEEVGSGQIIEAWAESSVLEMYDLKDCVVEFVTELLEDRFSLLRIVETTETISGVTFWVKYGKVVLSRDSVYGYEKTLSPEDAERLGQRLIDLSRDLMA